MQRARSFIVLLVIAIPLFWYAYRESKKGPVDDGPKRDKVFSVDAGKIEELEIKHESGERTTLRRQGSEWAIAQPIAAPSDEATVNGITSNLASMEVQRVIEENPNDVSEFGLASPRVEVAFKAAGAQQRLQIGEKTPSGTDVYARIADQKKVFLISSFLESTFNRSSFDLQDKSVLKLDREKVDTLAVRAGQEVRFAKANGEWALKAPVEGRAEFSAVDGLVSRLAGLQMKSIVPEPAAPQKYGLQKPAATVQIGSGSSQATLVLGAPAADDTVYARDLARPAVFTVDASLLEDLKKDPSEYRQKDLFDARSFNTSRVEIQHKGQSSTFEKSTAKDKDGKDVEKWKQVAPAARDVDAAKVEALISAATAARATSFAPSRTKIDAKNPELTVSLKYDGDKEERVIFVRDGTTVYAVRGGSSDVPGAAIVDAGTVENVVKALEALK
ncbi:MAG: DUF4340 domain-containing protein [Acidobacteriota bacterium]|nr:DUF4340 domain-containing protein [Acidobacteriota bacterium]